MRIFKSFGRLFFFALLSTVVLRPVVVDAASARTQMNDPLSTHAKTHIFLHSSSDATKVCKHVVNALVFKNIAKESMGAGVFVPQFSKVKLNLGQSHGGWVIAMTVPFTSSRPLVLRI